MEEVPKTNVETESHNDLKIQTSLSDRLSFNLIDQLHNATISLSKQSFEIKKICLTIEVASLTLIAQFVSNKIDKALFIAGFIIPITFYLLDVMTYFYQDRLRGRMIKEENLIRSRNKTENIPNKHSKCRIWRSFFNSSHLIYLTLIIIDVILGLCLKVF